VAGGLSVARYRAAPSADERWHSLAMSSLRLGLSMGLSNCGEDLDKSIVGEGKRDNEYKTLKRYQTATTYIGDDVLEHVRLNPQRPGAALAAVHGRLPRDSPSPCGAGERSSGI